jgi:hypothetical protein
MFFAQVGGRRRVGWGGFEQIQDRIPGPQGGNVVSSLGFTFIFQRKTQPFGIKLLHRGQISGNQRDMIKAFVGKHEAILADFG